MGAFEMWIAEALDRLGKQIRSLVSDRNCFGVDMREIGHSWFRNHA
jgi:hypothetical protein